MDQSTGHANMEYQQEESVNKPDDEQAAITLIKPQTESVKASLKERCSLKRGRAERGTLEEVEEELLRRKRQKREAWFDDEGNVVCVAITTPMGIQTYIPDAEGNLVPPSP